MKILNCPVCNDNGLFEYESYMKNPLEDEWTYNCFEDKKLAKCNKCGFIFTDKYFKEGELSKFYSELYKDNIFREYNPSLRYEFTARSLSHVNFIKTNIDLFDGMSILEIGPNENGMVPSFSLFCKPNYYYYEQYEFPVINHYGGKRLGNYFSKKEAMALKDDQKMDLITLSHSFEHFEPSSLNENVEAMSSALKEYGYISIEVPDETQMEMVPPHTLFFTVENLSSLLKNHGFEVVGTQLIKDTYQIDQVPSKKTSEKLGNKSSFFGMGKVLSFLISFRLLRGMIMKLLISYFTKRLKVMYDGRAYIRVLARKVS